MSQTIIALCTAEQLASAIPDWQRYGIQFANTSERLNRFQAADCILCLPETPVPLLSAAWQRFSQSRFFISQGRQQWLDGQTRQSVDFNQLLSTREQPKKEQQAVTTPPQQIQIKQSSNPPGNMTDNTLLFEIFKFAAWGLDNKDYQEKVNELLYLAAQRGTELSNSAQKNKKQGEYAYQLTQELEILFRKGDSTALNTWFNEQQASPELSQRIKKHLAIKLDKLNKNKDKRKSFTPTQGCLVRPPQFTQHHPNSLRHLPQHSNWEIVIDETGMEFERAEDLSIDDYSLGRYVALAIPQGRAKLDKLPETFHAAEEKPELLDKVINNILSQSVGVLGITAKDPLSFNRPRWFSGVYRLLQLALRLLPLPNEGSKQVHVFIEQRGGFNADTDLQVLKQLLLSELQSINEARFSQLHLSLEIAPKGKHPYLAHVDALAHCWGGSSAKQRLIKAKFKGHCFLTPESGDLERIYAALDGKTALSSHDWFQAVCALSGEPEHSLLREAMQQLGERCQTQPEIWQNYLQTVRHRLNEKDYHPQALDEILGWLQTYAPAENKLPPLLQLRFQAARLAADNHQGRMRLEAIQNLLDLGNQLKYEAAPEVAQVYNRLAVATTNIYEFDYAKQILEHALKLPEIAVDRQQYGRLLSGMGQIHAFSGEHQAAASFFAQAVETFEKLSDSTAAQKDIRQTCLYRLHNALDAGETWENIQPLATSVFGSDLDKAANKFSISPDDRFTHHALLRLLAAYPQQTASAQKTYLYNQAHWQSEAGHPWQLIHLWRGWLAHFAGNDIIAAEAFNHALDEEADGLTLQWIALTTAVLAERLGLGKSSPYPIAAEAARLEAELPKAPHAALWALQKSEAHPQKLLAALKACLPFNFK